MVLLLTVRRGEDESGARHVLYLAQAAVALLGVLTIGAAGTVAYRRQKTVEHQSRRDDERAKREADRAHRDRRNDLHRRYQEAATQLGHKEPVIRIAGVYAIEAIANEWAALDDTSQSQRNACIDLLCGYLRSKTGFAKAEDSDELKMTSSEEAVRNEIASVFARNLVDPKEDSKPGAWSDHRFKLNDTHFANAVFRNAHFLAGVTFVRAHFSGSAWFGGVTFSGSAWFEGVTFSGPAQFEDAIFNGDARFNGATFGDFAWLKGVTFSGPAQFEDAIFNGDARFNGATFSGSAWFEGVTFSDPAWFEGATFNGPAWFEGATFSGPAWFEGVTFSDPAWFEDATFSGPAWFGNATFNGDAEFEGAKFSERVGFAKAILPSSSVFRAAIFLLFSGWDQDEQGTQWGLDHATFSGADPEAIFRTSPDSPEAPIMRE
ncbi:MAG: pentapeptide repeat-containing protein [Promicromonosporaceae bacterium]|nr:pentapeptide repeat-containing protein [Promicromonosporaceae bacterium]